MLADGTTALDAVAAVAPTFDYKPLVLSSRIRGETANVLSAVAESCVVTGAPVEAPAVLLLGGETTVTIQGDGIGGPNQEFAPSAALELTNSDVVIASVDTDGIGGNSEAAAGIATQETADIISKVREALENNDAGRFFERRDELIVTGPTETNVNDFPVHVIPG